MVSAHGSVFNLKVQHSKHSVFKSWEEGRISLAAVCIHSRGAPHTK